MSKVKGFKWNKLVMATTKELDKAIMGHIIFGGNFFMELILPNALKLNSFEKLRVRLDKYISSHGGKIPEQITVNWRQRKEYNALFPRHGNPEREISYQTFDGIKLIPRNAQIK